MSSSTVSRRSSGRAEGPEPALMRLAAALFLGFLCFGLPLPVIPIFVKHSLGFGDVAVGISVGIQFLATVATRGFAGRKSDLHGGKRTMLQGSLICASAGCVYALAALLPLPSALKLLVLIVGRLAAGLGESQLVTGTLAWAIATAGPQRAGKAISWTGMAMYGALAAGAPIGMALLHAGGFLLVAGVSVLAPLLAVIFALGVPACKALSGERVPLIGVLTAIWRGGVSLSLQGVGFATIGAFASLYFTSRGWGHAGLAMSCFGGAFVVMRMVFGHLPDRLGGYPVAMVSMLIECIGQALLWLAPNEATALAGALVTGLGCSLVFPSLGIEALKAIPPHSRGTAMGGLIAFQDVAYGATGPITGVLASGYGYPTVYLVGAIAAAIGIVMASTARVHAGRPRAAL
jgi:MFS family permease